MSTRGIANSSNTVIIDFLERPSTSFCYVINANNGTFAVQSQGMFSKYNNKNLVVVYII